MLQQYISESDKCLETLFRRSALGLNITCVTYGDIYTPSFKGFRIVSPRMPIPAYSANTDMRILCLRGLYVESIDGLIMSNPKEYCDKVLWVSDPVDKVKERLMSLRSTLNVNILGTLSDTRAARAALLIYSEFDKYLSAEPVSLLDAVDKYVKLQEQIVPSCAKLSASAFCDIVCHKPEGGLCIDRLLGMELYRCLTESLSEYSACINLHSYLSYLSRMIEDFTELHRNNIIWNSLQLMACLRCEPSSEWSWIEEYPDVAHVYYKVSEGAISEVHCQIAGLPPAPVNAVYKSALKCIPTLKKATVAVAAPEGEVWIKYK